MATFTLIMAGGSGTRFWPLSRADRPKQLLPLAGGEESLLAATIRRAEAFSAPDHVLIITSRRLAEPTRAALPPGCKAQILAEPMGRNTAACIGWALTRVARIDSDATCVVLPADHHIEDEAAYTKTLERAVEEAAQGEVVTVGIKPNRPETGYGYIELGALVSEGVHQVIRFEEKPNLERAQVFFESGRFVWNSGMFIFQTRAMSEAIAEHLPQLSAALDRIGACPIEEEHALLEQEYAALPSISIDHGVMEKLSAVRVIPAEVGWSDLGSFESDWELSDKDRQRNVKSESTLLLDTEGCLVRAAAGKVVALVGLRDLVVVDTEDALLIMPRERAQDVKAIVAELAELGRQDRL